MHTKGCFINPCHLTTSPNALVIHLPGLHPTSQACSSFARPGIQWAKTKQSLIGKKGLQFLIQLLLSVWEIGYTHHPLLFSQASSSSSVRRGHELWPSDLISQHPCFHSDLWLWAFSGLGHHQRGKHYLPFRLPVWTQADCAGELTMIKCPGLAPRHVSVQHTMWQATDGDLETKYSAPCSTELPSWPLCSQCLPVFSLCELCPSVFCLPWLNQRT